MEQMRNFVNEKNNLQNLISISESPIHATKKEIPKVNQNEDNQVTMLKQTSKLANGRLVQTKTDAF